MKGFRVYLRSLCSLFECEILFFKLWDEYTKRKSGSDIEIKLESFLDRKISQSSGPILNKPSAHLQWLKYVAAAAIIIATVISIYTLSVRNHERIQDTFSDPQLAYQETQRVLMLVSTKINEGVKPLYNLEKMNEGTKHLHALNTIEKNLMILGIFEDNDNTDK